MRARISLSAPVTLTDVCQERFVVHFMQLRLASARSHQFGVIHAFLIWQHCVC